MKKNEQSLNKLYDNIKQPNVHVIGIQEKTEIM